MAIKAPLVRLTPFFILAVLVGMQTLILISMGTKIDSNVRRFLFDILSTLLGVYVILHLDQHILSSTKLHSVYAGIRSHFLPILGLFYILVFWQGKEKWKKESDYRIAVVITGLFITLILIHAYGAFGSPHCVHCLQPYFAFFSQLGVILLILVFPHFDKKILHRTQVVMVIITLLIFTGLGYVVDFYSGFPLLTFTFLYIAILAGLKLIFAEKRLLLKYSLCAFLAVSCLGIGLLISPTSFLGGGYQDLDCDIDIISYYETFGGELNQIIPEGAQVFWWGSSPVPLLYLPDRGIYPAQLNSTAYFVGRDSDVLLKRGFWNDLLGQQWVYEADYLILKSGAKKLKEDEFQIVLQKPIPGNCQRELGYTVYQHLP
jgi:hypothetical protein